MTTQGTPSLPNHTEELGAVRCYANLVTTRSQLTSDKSPG